ncbi:Leucine-rich repeat receptor protein kinase EXS [Wickerhamomyces ciferrii]|uniref:Leucine-rich repeat receptor protein kinase EXS n=1 Tax=Wickerhamomyces ciferrii (strain ATCC 14091 / BCRC 22168 / CBS 111 / JCM 3599 / NBRC 0793 / NRRL Y-1031 F-60-10) TaxID=1206466 RepID=K0KRB3_WICCF|nr:Leucine-rich repeat receptor protein kinase EXS [Wickerhamomyces ciferrii]CCH44622.1 Leucine-rich repeat receptor protein kinase EXS [Wickerhamomyces ciferrii]
MMNSPTKQITEGFQKLHLSSSDEININLNQQKVSRSNSETLTSAKNHLHIPKLIFNKDFANESKVGELSENMQLKNGGDVGDDGSLVSDDTVAGKNGEIGSDDTVIHNEDKGNDTIPEWLAVKLQIEQQKGQQPQHSRVKPKLINRNDDFASHHIKPKLANSINDSIDDNETWNEIKKQYNINDITDLMDKLSDFDDDLSDENNDIRLKPNTTTTTTHKDLNDTSVFSFQDLNNLRVISDAQSSSNGTKKVTSFKSNNFIDSPMSEPKIIKSIKNLSKNDNKQPLLNSDILESLNPQNDNIQLHLITPIDQNMKFDTDLGKWIYPNDSKKSGSIKYDDILEIDDEEDEDKDEKHTHKHTQKISHKNQLLQNTFQPDESIRNLNSNSNNSLTIDPNQVTNISHLDISFSESQKTLIKALTSSIKPNSNWDSIENVDLSRRNLISVKCLNEFIPNLISIDLDYNNITTIEGLSSNLTKISISHNKISNNFLNFSKFQYLHKLDISFNKIDNMQVFTNLRNLRSLNLSNNEIKEFIELRSLQHLNLSKNKIKNSIDFTKFEKNSFLDLESLDLSYNEIPKIILTNLPKLRSLKINNNKDFLKTFELNESIPNLKKLNLIGNANLKKIVFFNKIINLKSLSFDGGSTIINGDLPQIEVLKIVNDFKLENFLKSIDNNNSLRLNKHILKLSIKNCGIDSNFLNSLKIINLFPHLQKINLENNNIKMTNINLITFLKKFKNLTQVKLDNNPIINDLKDEQDKKLFKLMIKKLLSEF